MQLRHKQIVLSSILILISFAACSKFATAKPKNGTQLSLKVECKAADCDRFRTQTITILKTRAKAIGASITVEQKGADQIVLRIGEMPNMERVKNVLLSEGRMELRAVVSPPNPSPMQIYSSFDEAKSAAKNGQDVFPYIEYPDEKTYVIVKAESIITNKDIRDVEAITIDGEDYIVSFSLKANGSARLGAWTAANINQYLAVVLNKEVKNVVYIKGQITLNGEISGCSKEQAEDLSLILRSGSLPVPVKVLEEKVFGL